MATARTKKERSSLAYRTGLDQVLFRYGNQRTIAAKGASQSHARAILRPLCAKATTKLARYTASGPIQMRGAATRSIWMKFVVAESSPAGTRAASSHIAC